jgi:hypothetical protein
MFPMSRREDPYRPVAQGLDELTKLGLMTADERSAARKATNEDIRAMG